MSYFTQEQANLFEHACAWAGSTQPSPSGLVRRLGVVVGRIMNAAAAVGSSWLWTYGFDPRERQPAHGYEPTREDAMAAVAKSWRQE